MTGDTSWADVGKHTLGYRPRSTGNRIGQSAANTLKIPIGNGTLVEGLILRVTVPEYFERISRSRAGWAHPWEEIEKVLKVANQRMANELQYLVLEALEEGRVRSRRGVSTGRLEAALSDPRNVRVTGRRFAVGDAAFLSRSQAKYWRQIDAGTSVHVGKSRGGGYWIDGGGRPSSNDEARRDGRFVPAMGRNARGRQILGDDGKSLVRRMVINRPIEPQQYFERAWKRFNARGQALDALRGAITQVLGIPMTGVRRSFDATIATMR